MIWMLAQVPTNGSEWSGWSAVAVLMFVLSWLLFKKLPDDATQSDKKDAAHRELIKGIIDGNQKIVADMQAVGAQAVKEANERSEKRVDALTSTFNLHMREVRDDDEKKLQLILQHCDDESQRKSTELSNISALLHKDIDMLRTAFELIAHAPAVMMTNDKRK